MEARTNMLREIVATRQVPGEARRRWFTSPSIDLFVWTDDQGAPTGFQLCYDKQDREHALTWTAENGFNHMTVDAGESRPARYKGSPILVADGVIDTQHVLEQFRGEAASVPVEFVRFVEGKIAALAAGVK
jgi:hypothetical protein